jgi:Mrp family chromosome partitioning ATPase
LTRRLALLPAGRPAADQIGALGSERMRRVLVDAAASFDWVILDSAPIVAQPETGEMAAMVDVAVLVINAGKTPHDLVLRAVEALGRDRLAGVVLNRVDDSVQAATSGIAGADRYQTDSRLGGGTEMALAD